MENRTTKWLEFDFHKIMNFKESKLKSYLNSNHKKMITNLYLNIDSEKTQTKLKFLQENGFKSQKEILNLLKEIDKKNGDSNFYVNLIFLLLSHNLDETNFQKELEKINEMSNERKKKGVYYTPEDITDFILYNSIYQLITKEFSLKFEPLHPKKIVSEILKLSESKSDKIVDFISNISVFDPTCGTGAFLLQILHIKLNLIKKIKNEINPLNVNNIIDNLKGNDLDSFSTYISKIRIIFKCIYFCKGINLEDIYDKLKNNLTNYNFISEFKFKDKFDLIVGNPPYIEKTKTNYSNLMRYGNTYADVVHNSINLLKPFGILGFIIPLSYVSTARMKLLRNFVETNAEYQYILSYNDRPDCLFIKVHQKLSILFISKNKNKNHKIFTSDYKYWYKKERLDLFLNNNVVSNENNFDEFYSKVGNEMEKQLLSKIMGFNTNLISLENKNESNLLYLNKRATFWIKSFIKKPYNLNEYKIMKLTKDNLHLANAIFNSSLYWWFWIKISDCWHITNKELLYFTIPQINRENLNKLMELSLRLNDALEKTKEKINTKQAMYEYKHKNCKMIIDKIDDQLADIYSLTDFELDFIKKYNQKYRLGQNN